MKNCKGDSGNYISVPLAFFSFLLNSVKSLPVSEIMVIYYAGRETGYYVCPKCKITLEREFMSYCDRCGQKLDWKNYRKAKIIYPSSDKH